MSAVYGLAVRACLAAFALHPKVRLGWARRRGLLERLKPKCDGLASRPWWFHVASSGELEQAIPILDALKDAGDPIFVSFFSPSAERAVRLEEQRRLKAGKAVPWDIVDYCPFDLPEQVCAFVTMVRPRAFVAIHREVWPGMLKECRRQKVPCYLFVATAPQGLGRLFYRRWLRAFDYVGTVDGDAARTLGGVLSPERIRALGDPRVDRVQERKKLHVPGLWQRALLDGKPILLLASFWPSDFACLKRQLEEILKQGHFRLVLVPHEPHARFVANLSVWLKENGALVQTWSQWHVAPDPASQLIVDKIGFLAELYAAAHVVFVGGSFRRRVHNVLEPAAYGRPVFTGPRIHHSPEAKALCDQGLLHVLRQEESWVTFLTELTKGERYQLWQEGLLRYLQSRSGAGKRYAELLQELGSG